MTSSSDNCTSSENHKLKKFNVPLGIITQGKTCLEKLKTLLKIIDSTTSILIRSSKRWSLAAAISVGIDEKDEIISDEDTLSGKNSSTNLSLICIQNFFKHLNFAPKWKILWFLILARKFRNLCKWKVIAYSIMHLFLMLKVQFPVDM